MSATLGWYKHWLLKCKDQGDPVEIVEDEDPVPSSSSSVSVSMLFHLGFVFYMLIAIYLCWIKEKFAYIIRSLI